MNCVRDALALLSRRAKSTVLVRPFNKLPLISKVSAINTRSSCAAIPTTCIPSRGCKPLSSQPLKRGLRNSLYASPSANTGVFCINQIFSTTDIGIEYRLARSLSIRYNKHLSGNDDKTTCGTLSTRKEKDASVALVSAFPAFSLRSFAG